MAAPKGNDYSEYNSLLPILEIDGKICMGRIEDNICQVSGERKIRLNTAVIYGNKKILIGTLEALAEIEIDTYQWVNLPKITMKKLNEIAKIVKSAACNKTNNNGTRST